MDTLDLHPEELFDKVSRGLASNDERARVDAHLASCATCRFERQARIDFASVGGSTADLDELVARALSGAQVAVPRAPRGRRFGALLIAASVTLLGFGSFAAVAQFTLVLPRLFSPRPDEVVPAQLPKTPLAPPQVPVPAPVPVPVAEPVAVEPAQVRVEAPPAVTLQSGRPVVKRTAPVVSPAPELPAAPVEPDAIAVLARATQARVSGETTAAIRDFRFIVARFPSTPEAALSYAALGRLLLDRGEAASALEAFEAYLASSDQLLREDVQGSRAMALQRLGRFDQERAAWEAVLHDYPAGVFAPRARNRLDSLTP